MENTTELRYSGSVSINININGKSIDVHKHNRGLPELFKMIVKSLCGYNVEKEKPCFVDLRYANTEDADDWTPCLSKKQSVSQIYYTIDNGSWCARISSMIPYASIITNINNLSNDKHFRVYLSNSNSDLAYISVQQSELILIKPGTQALVEWVLKFSNLEV